MFRSYAKYYDLINRDKRYDKEVAYIASRLRAVSPGVSEILELGSGTGRHGYLLAARGFHVHGIDLSRDMVEIPQAGTAPGPGSFRCEIGDIRTMRLGRRFDAVISLFHVLSYQTTDADFAAVLETATCHLLPGGLFLFDVWHGPAVLAQRPTVRIKAVSEGSLKVSRTSRAELNEADNIVIVNLDFVCEDSATGERVSFSERHPMRYIFEDDVARAIARTFKCLAVEEMLTAAPPSIDTWAVTYLLQRL